MNSLPSIACEAVRVKTKQLHNNSDESKNGSSIQQYSSTVVEGYDFNKGINYSAILQSFLTTGFTATTYALAVKQIHEMLKHREDQFDEDIHETDPFIRRKTGCTIFLGYTSNLISSGLRDIIRFLVQHKMVDCIVTTAGGIEEDLIKCLAPTYVGEFSLNGSELRENGINRIGNLLVPNDNYCSFENWIMPIFDELFTEQNEFNQLWTPSKVITRLGEKINNEESVCYWAAVNKIPIFCPTFTDGSIGDMLFLYSYRKTLVIDIVQDIKRLNTVAMKAQKSGVIILGTGPVKHHINNANLMRNGADYAVFINTAEEFDGSDSGARPDEAKSWGKIRREAKPVKVHADATLVFPLIVAETFATHHHYSVSKKIS